ncbi:MAG: GNAT family N-acetyltransferase [Solirubrobacteraceae bacterium]
MPGGQSPILTDRLVLEPLRLEHADEMVSLLSDLSLFGFTGGTPPTLDALRATYGRWATERCGPSGERWLNWVARERRIGAPVGWLQATLTGGRAELAWTIGNDYQGRGLAREAAAAVVDQLRGAGIRQFVAHIHPQHNASIAVATAIGMLPTDRSVDGEVVWATCG